MEKSVEEYISQIEPKYKEGFLDLRKVILENLPEGFKEEMSYGSVGYIVPHSIYPAGYHCDTKLPLPFMGIAARKNFISFYNMGVYADNELYNWFVGEFPKYSKKKLDMGKSCVRFKKAEDIPFHLIGELVSKMSVEQWIEVYERSYLKK